MRSVFNTANLGKFLSSTLAFTIYLGVTKSSFASSALVETLVDHGDSSNRITMALLGEGYTQSDSDQEKLSHDAQTVLSALFSVAPYKEYYGLFNVKLIHTISVSSVVARSASPLNKSKTALGCYYGCSGVDRLICCDGGSEGTVAHATYQNVPEATISLVLVNDTKYGGSGGNYTVLSLNPYAIQQIAPHELGHTIGHLADEYDEALPSFPACDPIRDCDEPNVTLFPKKSGKWAHWVDETQEIPTPENRNGVGYYEGARYQKSGVYRSTSKPGCTMRVLGGAFCPVCAEAMILAFWEHVSLIDSVLPESAEVKEKAACETQRFSVVVPKNAGKLEIDWLIDDVIVATRARELVLDSSELPAGSHKITVQVVDKTPSVRKDEDSATSRSQTWTWITSCKNVSASSGPRFSYSRVVTEKNDETGLRKEPIQRTMGETVNSEEKLSSSDSTGQQALKNVPQSSHGCSMHRNTSRDFFGAPAWSILSIFAFLAASFFRNLVFFRSQKNRNTFLFFRKINCPKWVSS